MKTRLEARLQALEAEQARGGPMLAHLDQQRQDLTNTLLRIAGAIEVLREVLAQEAQSAQQIVRGEPTTVDDKEYFQRDGDGVHASSIRPGPGQ